MPNKRTLETNLANLKEDLTKVEGDKVRLQTALSELKATNVSWYTAYTARQERLHSAARACFWQIGIVLNSIPAEHFTGPSQRAASDMAYGIAYYDIVAGNRIVVAHEQRTESVVVARVEPDGEGDGRLAIQSHDRVTLKPGRNIIYANSAVMAEFADPEDLATLAIVTGMVQQDGAHLSLIPSKGEINNTPHTPLLYPPPTA